MIHDVHVPTDTLWFDKQKDSYLSSARFREFEQISGVDLSCLASSDPEERRKAQLDLCNKSVIFNAVRSTIGDYFCPLVYTHELGLVSSVPDHNPDIDNIILSSDMTDALRRRHLAVSFSILPRIIQELNEKKRTAITIKNLGSGMGIDVINAIIELGKSCQRTEYVASVDNIDLDTDLLDMGERIKHYLESKGLIKSGVLKYQRKDLFMSRDKADLVVLVGYICGTRDDFAVRTLDFVRKTITEGGQLVVSSANHLMRSTDPLYSFLIQHLGLHQDKERGYPDDPLFGWPLNFRTKDQMKSILVKAGYRNIQIFDDANFPGREAIESKMQSQVDCLPSIALGLRTATYSPLILPPQDIIERRFGYNWIALAER